MQEMREMCAGIELPAVNLSLARFLARAGGGISASPFTGERQINTVSVIEGAGRTRLVATYRSMRAEYVAIWERIHPFEGWDPNGVFYLSPAMWIGYYLTRSGRWRPFAASPDQRVMEHLHDLLGKGEVEVKFSPLAAMVQGGGY